MWVVTRTALFIGGLVGMAFGGVIANVGIEWWKLHRERAQILPLLTEVIRKTAVGLPRRVDDVTTLVSVSTADLEIIYIYRVDVALSTATEWAEVRRRLVRQVCANPVAPRAMMAGVIYKSMYFDSSKRLLSSITISRPDCP